MKKIHYIALNLSGFCGKSTMASYSSERDSLTKRKLKPLLLLNNLKLIQSGQLMGVGFNPKTLG